MAYKKQQKPEVQSTTVVMVRDPNIYPDPPHQADVHRNEVENWRAAGWTEKK